MVKVIEGTRLACPACQSPLVMVGMATSYIRIERGRVKFIGFQFADENLPEFDIHCPQCGGAFKLLRDGRLTSE